jgi:DNA end-binding protein Ku
MATKARKSPAPRASANLNVGFGLVSVPFALRPLAETGRAVSGKYVCPQHGPNLTQRYLCSEGTPQEHLLAQGEQVTAYEHPEKPGEFVVVDSNVLREIAEERSGRVEVEKIVDVSTIDPIYFDKTYLCWPQAGGEEAFDLFAAILRAEGKAAVSTVVLSKQTVTLVIRYSPETGTLVAHTCRFHSQVRWADVELVAQGEERGAPSEKHLAAARALLSSMEGNFSAGEVVDRYTPMLEDAVRAAASGVTFTAPQATPVVATEDLLDALMASVQPAKKPARKAKVKA